MLRLLRSSKIFVSQGKSTSKRFASSSAVKDVFHQPDATPEEIELVNKRLKLKKALKAEFLRKVSDPHCTEPLVFDPQIQRYYSMHMTVEDRFIPTFKNWCVYMLTVIIPIVVVANLFKYNRDRFIPTFKNWCVYMLTVIIPIVVVANLLKYNQNKLERKIRSGELPYEERIFKF